MNICTVLLNFAGLVVFYIRFLLTLVAGICARQTQKCRRARILNTLALPPILQTDAQLTAALVALLETKHPSVDEFERVARSAAHLKEMFIVVAAAALGTVPVDFSATAIDARTMFFQCLSNYYKSSHAYESAAVAHHITASTPDYSWVPHNKDMMEKHARVLTAIYTISHDIQALANRKRCRQA